MEAGFGQDELSAVAEVAEACVWNALTVQSAADLHVFTPLVDTGLDGVVHRISDGAYVDVQVKARSTVREGGAAELVVWEASLRNPDALVIGVGLAGETLAPYSLVTTEVELAGRAHRSSDRGEPVLVTSFHPRGPQAGGTWNDRLVPSGRLAERLGAAAPARAASEVEPEPWLRSDHRALGALAEAELKRRLLEMEAVEIYLPRLDREPVELVLRHGASRRHLGLQVKCVGVDGADPAPSVAFRRSSWRPAPDLYAVVLPWRREAGGFDAECLLIPSSEVLGLCRVEGNAMRFDYRPHGGGRLRRYALPAAELPGRLEELVRGG